MKKLLLTLPILVVFSTAYSQQNNGENKQKKTYTKREIKEIRKKHEGHLANNKINKYTNESIIAT